MDQLRMQIELASYDEKTMLAELEEAKAAVRVKELKYEKARFTVEWLTAVARAQEQQQQQNQTQKP